MTMRSRGTSALGLSPASVVALYRGSTYDNCGTLQYCDTNCGSGGGGD